MLAPPMMLPSRARSLLTRLVLVVCATGVGFLLVEALVRGFDLMAGPRAIATGTVDVYETSPEAASEALGESEIADERPASRWILHPFRGVTPRPRYDDENTAKIRFRSNVFGIRSLVDDPRTELAAEDLVVGIFGGSFARIISHHGSDAVEAAIREQLGPSAPRIRVINFALSGYKQPQQTFVLSELLLLGVPIDVVVNIDGYNESALTLSDANLGHHPLYPHFGFWNAALGLSTGTLSMAQIERTADVARFRRRAAAWRARVGTAMWGRSAIAQAIVGTHIARLEVAAVEAEEALRELPNRLPTEDRFRLDDPCLGKEPANRCLDLIIELWLRGSHLMASTAETFGARYVHVLQPNQYVDGSKVLSAEERRVAWNPEREWSRAAIRGYPRLREAGRRLRAAGIDFHDLTQIFAEHDETIYTDTCCHINPFGADIVGAEIGRHVATVLATDDSPPAAQIP